ncbi:MAG: hypothetical protein RJA07_1318 [Bacteroidota bacterium]
MIKNVIALILVLQCIASSAQFAPAVGHLGTTAIYKDSSIFIGWATGCHIKRGYQDISDSTIGLANYGDSTNALGKAGTNGFVSLGDGGEAIVTFAHPVFDAAGWDFAIFENSFLDTFLELGFVEVSSDGINYFRFKATSNTQDTIQIGGFGYIQPTHVNNLAGKYRANYGTPFDLKELDSIVGLNIDSITHIKIIDVVGCIQNKYATYDINGNKINDPWKTPFPSSGFDLDAVGLIHTQPSLGIIDNEGIDRNLKIYPNPAHEWLTINDKWLIEKTIEITDVLGRVMVSLSNHINQQIKNSSTQQIQIDVSGLPNGIYFIKATQVNGNVMNGKFVKE